MAGRAARVTPALTGPLPPTPPPPCACVSRGGERRRPRPSPPGSSRLSPASSVPSQEPGPGHAEPTGPAARALATGRGGPCRRGCLLSESEPTPRAVTVTDPGLHGQRQAGRDRRRVLPSPFSSQLRPPAGAGGNRGSVLGSCSRPQRRASARGAVSWPLRILNHDCHQGAQKPFLSPTP